MKGRAYFFSEHEGTIETIALDTEFQQVLVKESIIA
jgi:hypothetical protein